MAVTTGHTGLTCHTGSLWELYQKLVWDSQHKPGPPQTNQVIQLPKVYDFPIQTQKDGEGWHASTGLLRANPPLSTGPYGQVTAQPTHHFPNLGRERNSTSWTFQDTSDTVYCLKNDSRLQARENQGEETRQKKKCRGMKVRGGRFRSWSSWHAFVKAGGKRTRENELQVHKR